MLTEANKFRYEYMRLDKIRNVLKIFPVAIQPSGLLEWHGGHNSIGLDGTKANYICERTMLLLGNGALMPVNWIGTYGYTRYEGTICYHIDTTERVFFEIYKELIKIGFKVIVILTGHYGNTQMSALFRALKSAEKFAERYGYDVKLLGLKPPDLVPDFGGDHAKEFETSMLWRTGEAYGIDLVDLTDFKMGKESPFCYDLNEVDEKRHEPEEWNWTTDLKNLDICSPEYGEKLIDGISRGLACEVIEMLEDLGIEYTPPNGPIEPPI